MVINITKMKAGCGDTCPIIPTLRRFKRKDHKSETCVGHTGSTHLNKQEELFIMGRLAWIIQKGITRVTHKREGGMSVRKEVKTEEIRERDCFLKKFLVLKQIKEPEAKAAC